MSPLCPRCLSLEKVPSEGRIVGHGSFYRRSDKKTIHRFLCCECEHTFSTATSDPCYRQKKRQLNPKIYELLCSVVSQRRTARLLKTTRKTVIRKFFFLAAQAETKLADFNRQKPIADTIQFDDLETFEHTKYKPVSVFLAVEEGSRRILALEAASMPCKGPLAKTSRKKYGIRADGRNEARAKGFQTLLPLFKADGIIKSDSNPHYLEDVKRFFPHATYKRILGSRGAHTGQGELKKIGFDPIFSLNHTCGMLRANVNRLVRKTWCTTKKIDRLQKHLVLYALYHNEWLDILTKQALAQRNRSPSAA